jgi:hypothetical protein
LEATQVRIYAAVRPDSWSLLHLLPLHTLLLSASFPSGRRAAAAAAALHACALL